MHNCFSEAAATIPMIILYSCGSLKVYEDFSMATASGQHAKRKMDHLFLEVFCLFMLKYPYDE